MLPAARCGSTANFSLVSQSDSPGPPPRRDSACVLDFYSGQSQFPLAKLRIAHAAEFGGMLSMVCGRRGSRRSILTLQESPGLKTRVTAQSLLGIELRQFEIAVARLFRGGDFC